MSAPISRVYKYPLTFGDWVSVPMPEGAEVLCVQIQHDEPFLWARVTPENPPALRHFRIAGTGHDLGSNVGRYVGTFQMHDGDLVMHVFEDGPSEATDLLEALRLAHAEMSAMRSAVGPGLLTDKAIDTAAAAIAKATRIAP